MIPRYYGVDFDEKMVYLEKSRFERMPEIKFSYLLVHLQIIGYLIASFLAVKKYKTLLLENYSNASLFNYKWLFTLLVIFAFESGVASIKNVYMFLKIEDAYYYSLVFTSVLALAFIIWLVFKALQSPEFFRGIDSNLQLVKSIANEEEKSYSISDQNRETEVQIMIDKLELFMIQNEPYLDPSLTLYNLSKQIEIPDRDLSVLINRDLDLHFFDFVNGYRIRKSMEILRDPNKSEFTVLEILYDVGFNSKSSFNTAFKKYTGITPTQYRKTNTLTAA
jgi:AraC-like DNA-binding protein